MGTAQIYIRYTTRGGEAKSPLRINKQPRTRLDTVPCGLPRVDADYRLSCQVAVVAVLNARAGCLHGASQCPTVFAEDDFACNAALRLGKR